MSRNALRTFVLLSMALGLLVLSSCGDPKAIDRAKAEQERAKARQIEIEAEATRAAGELEREIKATQTAQDMANKQASWEATQGSVNFAKTLFFSLVGIAFALAISALLFITVMRTGQVTKALAKKAAYWSVSVPVDPETGNYPLIVLKGHVIDMNTGKVVKVGEALEANPQLAAGAMYNRALGIATQGAKAIAKSTKSAAATDAIFTSSGSIPVIGGPLEKERQAIQNSPLPDFLKNKIDQALARRENEVREGEIVEHWQEGDPL